MRATLYVRPDGYRTRFEITEIEDDDRAFFEYLNIGISLEISQTAYILYAKIGPSEWDELTYIVPRGQTCRQAMTALRKLCEDALRI